MESDLLCAKNKNLIFSKGFYIYKGLDKKTKELVYIGTTVQVPNDRFRWHKANGKDLIFEVIKICENQTDMLDLEYDLIKKYNPKLNKITNRKQNYNVALTKSEIELRKGNNEWCQKCLTRRVNSGYNFCYYCK
jgi:hypothetical protein